MGSIEPSYCLMAGSLNFGRTFSLIISSINGESAWSTSSWRSNLLSLCSSDSFSDCSARLGGLLLSRVVRLRPTRSPWQFSLLLCTTDLYCHGVACWPNWPKTLVRSPSFPPIFSLLWSLLVDSSTSSTVGALPFRGSRTSAGHFLLFQFSEK